MGARQSPSNDSQCSPRLATCRYLCPLHSRQYSSNSQLHTFGNMLRTCQRMEAPLPLVLSFGKPASLNSLTVEQLECFLMYVRDHANLRGMPLTFSSEYNKSYYAKAEYLRSVIRRLYDQLGSGYLIELSEGLAKCSANSISFHVDPHTRQINVWNKRCGSVIARLPPDNLVYDIPIREKSCPFVSKDITVIPIIELDSDEEMEKTEPKKFTPVITQVWSESADCQIILSDSEDEDPFESKSTAVTNKNRSTSTSESNGISTTITSLCETSISPIDGRSINISSKIKTSVNTSPRRSKSFIKMFTSSADSQKSQQTKIKKFSFRSQPNTKDPLKCRMTSKSNKEPLKEEKNRSIDTQNHLFTGNTEISITPLTEIVEIDDDDEVEEVSVTKQNRLTKHCREKDKRNGANARARRSFRLEESIVISDSEDSMDDSPQCSFLHGLGLCRPKAPPTEPIILPRSDTKDFNRMTRVLPLTTIPHLIKVGLVPRLVPGKPGQDSSHTSTHPTFINKSLTRTRRVVANHGEKKRKPFGDLDNSRDYKFLGRHFKTIRYSFPPKRKKVCSDTSSSSLEGGSNAAHLNTTWLRGERRSDLKLKEPRVVLTKLNIDPSKRYRVVSSAESEEIAVRDSETTSPRQRLEPKERPS